MQLECFCRFSLSPRGDGNPSYSSCVIQPLRFSLSPRGDGNNLPCQILFHRRRFSLSPRGDGNTYMCKSAFSPRRFSLSPRGDGNGVFFDGNHISLPIFFIPARGRKRLPCGLLCSFRHDFLYPREGTETVYRKRNCADNRRIFFIPARGRKRGVNCYLVVSYLIFFIPARGRKRLSARPYRHSTGFSLSPRGDGNSFSASPNRSMQIFFIPARGRKRRLICQTVNRDGDFLYPREGTETSGLKSSSATMPDFLYPREGTETQPTPPAFRFHAADFLYPREGTETETLGNCRTTSRFSLSPQGATIPNKNRHFCHPSIYKQCVVC